MSQEQFARWLKAFLITAVIFLIFFNYYLFRHWAWSLSIPNKTLGATAIVVAGFSLLIGPLSWKLLFLKRFLTIRRELGLWAFVAALVHMLISLFFISDRFTLKWYLEQWLPTAAGFLAVFVWIYMTYLSRNHMIVSLGSSIWKSRLSWAGKISFLAVFVHLVILKNSEWIRWWQGTQAVTAYLKNPSWPPGSLIVGAVMLGIIVYRIIADLKPKK